MSLPEHEGVAFTWALRHRVVFNCFVLLLVEFCRSKATPLCSTSNGSKHVNLTHKICLSGWFLGPRWPSSWGPRMLRKGSWRNFHVGARGVDVVVKLSMYRQASSNVSSGLFPEGKRT